jgi:hypothetical protein
MPIHNWGMALSKLYIKFGDDKYEKNALHYGIPIFCEIQC